MLVCSSFGNRPGSGWRWKRRGRRRLRTARQRSPAGDTEGGIWPVGRTAPGAARPNGCLGASLRSVLRSGLRRWDRGPVKFSDLPAVMIESVPEAGIEADYGLQFSQGAARTYDIAMNQLPIQNRQQLLDAVGAPIGTGIRPKAGRRAG